MYSADLRLVVVARADHLTHAAATSLPLYSPRPTLEVLVEGYSHSASRLASSRQGVVWEVAVVARHGYH